MSGFGASTLRQNLNLAVSGTSIYDRAWDEVDMFVDEVAAALNRVNDGLDQAAAVLSAAEPG